MQAAVAVLRYCPEHALVATERNHIFDNSSPGWFSSTGSQEYEARVFS